MAPEPRWWHECNGRGNEPAARCELCFRGCRIVRGALGFCGVRGYDGRGFHSSYLGRFSAVALDPIEKKPLYHWRPGTFILSLGGVGCNMSCPFCQNHRIAHPEAMPTDLPYTAPETLLRYARKYGVDSVAYTYNEPTLQAEYIVSAAPLLASGGIATVLVTNGMFSESLAEALARCTSAANIDVKAFDAAKYRALGGSLETVQANVERFLRAGVHVELTHLVVPGIGDAEDDFERMIEWIASLSGEIPLHISRYFPSYRYRHPPTDVRLLEAFAKAARQKLAHVHLGNVGPGR